MKLVYLFFSKSALISNLSVITDEDTVVLMFPGAEKGIKEEILKNISCEILSIVNNKSLIKALCSHLQSKDDRIISFY